MEEEQYPSPEYIKGFNQMYKLKNEMPDVAQQMLSVKTEGDRFKGVKAGAKQLELERIRKVSQKSKQQDRNHEI